MTLEERCKRPEHHVVHDYANLVSSGRIRLAGEHGGVQLQDIAPVNTHVWDAFYLNCRKMFEFFKHGPNGKYSRASDFIAADVEFKFQHWTFTVQNHMEIHLLHVGRTRATRDVVWSGRFDQKYLEDFESAWRTVLQNLKPSHREVFKDEISFRLHSAFRHCGDLGLEFIL
jgi:hypothetical protein